MKSEIPFKSCKRPFQTLNENPSVDESESGSLSDIEPPSAGFNSGKSNEVKITKVKGNPETIGKSLQNHHKHQEQTPAQENVD